MSRSASLKNKNVLITGGSMGIGLACAEEALASGANVLICARTQEPLDAALKQLQKKGYQNVLSQTADISKLEDVDHLLNTIKTHWSKLDGVIHAAGIYGPIGPITEVNPEEWWKALNINLFGTFLISRQSCLSMKETGGGRIVLFSGGGASTPFPYYTAYACSKVSVVRFAETLAQEMKSYSIEVNCLAPGFVATRLHEQTLTVGENRAHGFFDFTRKKLESGSIPVEVPAKAAIFLLSDQAKGINGKFVAAPFDGWDKWPLHLKELEETDIFTLRRILPKERGMDWQ